MTHRPYPPDPDAGFVRPHAEIHSDLLKVSKQNNLNALEKARSPSLSKEELELLSWIFKEYGVHKQYPAFVDRIDALKAEASGRTS